MYLSTFVFCAFPRALKDVTRLSADSQSHLYEDVRHSGLYQDILASSLASRPPLFDHRLPHQWNEWRSPTHPQVRKQTPNPWWGPLFDTLFTLHMHSVSQQGAERAREFMDVQQPQRDSDLPFELRGELV